ncbi:hypothetical protein DYB32_003236 [Aphanomyces invadans]|uniref:Uncharacterized protein n=1 Tax=Aphanomyces invadans TaxID=157072 RepID=A0A418B164_9STRA|nr:hypothetical protein DYB32_003236 [Aphanomyces invadans]
MGGIVRWVGVFGWGNKSPLFNMLPNYWPVAELNRVNPNHIIVDVGKVSSDHDRACEAFYQLYGGQVDYGEAHSAENGAAALQNFYFPWLKHIYDLDLGHWTNNTTWEMFYSTRSAVHTSRDLVNTYSQVYPRVEGPKCADSPALDRRPRSESHMSIDLEAENEVDNHTTQLIKGTWHTYRMGKNHLCGTHWDKEAHHLYTHLFKLLNKWVAQTTAADPAPR